jgi:hypothetical protein
MWAPDDFERLAALWRLIVGWLRKHGTLSDNSRSAPSSVLASKTALPARGATMRTAHQLEALTATDRVRLGEGVEHARSRDGPRHLRG